VNLLREKQRCADTHRLNFGGSSNSSSAQTTNQYDNRITNGTNGIVAQGGSTVSVLDAGAIQNALAFAGDTVQTAIAGQGTAAKNAIDVVASSNSKALDFAKQSQGQALDSLNTTSNLVKDAYADAKGRGALTDKILIGAIAMAGVVAFAAVRK
jgi:hypothetical protein